MPPRSACDICAKRKVPTTLIFCFLQHTRLTRCRSNVHCANRGRHAIGVATKVSNALRRESRKGKESSKTPEHLSVCKNAVLLLTISQVPPTMLFATCRAG